MEEEKKPVRWLRIGIAALIAQLIPLIVLVALVTVYSFTAAPGLEQGAYEAFVLKAGKYTGPVIGTFATLGMAFWAARKQTNAWLKHGMLTGALVLILDLIIYASQESGIELLFLLSLPVKFLAGALGGYLAQRRYQHLPAEVRKSHRLI